MKASVVWEVGGPFVTSDVEVATPIGKEVLVEVKASGLCHSDYATAQAGYLPIPAVFGHEAAGVVVEIGPDVTEFAAGDHVVGCLVQYCGACRKCLSGAVTQCLNPNATVRGADEPPRLTVDGQSVFQGMALGGFAERMLVHEAQLVKIPNDVPFAQAALIGCGVVTGAGTVINTAGVEAGSSVVVIGVGGVGLSAVSGAVIAGATTIIAVDVAAGKLERAKTFGATHVIDSSVTDPVEAVLEITGGADHVIDCVGAAGVQRQGLDMLTRTGGGGLYLVGVGGGQATIELSSMEMLMGKYRVEGAYMGSTNPKRDIPMFVDLYQQGRLNLDGLVSREIALSEVQEAYKTLSDPSVARVVITDFAR